MATATDNLGQGLFGIQLEVTAKLLEAERKKLTQLQLQLEQKTGRDLGNVEKAKEVERQEETYIRLTQQHRQLTKEYEVAARGVLRRSTKQRKSSRSLPSLGCKQTVKSRPTIFGTMVHDQQEGEHSMVSPRRRTLICNPESPRLLNNNTAMDLLFEDGHLVAGKLDGLIERLIPSPTYYPDRTYVFAFLLCSRLFILPTRLLSRIAKKCADEISRASQIEAIALGGNLVQLLSEWTETFPNDFREEAMMTHLRDITSYCASLSVELRKSVGQITQSLFKKLAVLDKYEDILSKAREASQETAFSDVRKFKSLREACPSPHILVQQLCHIELERMANIGPEEFVQTFIPREEGDLQSTLCYIKRTRSLEAYVEWFNRLSLMVATEVCVGARKKHRAKSIEYFSEVATECYNIGNFNSSMAITAGLSMSPVARLKKTWGKVKTKKFDKLERQMNPASNFASYRVSLKLTMEWKARWVCLIPFFSLFIKDVYFLNEGNPNRLSTGYINFEKFWQLSKLITEFVTWQEAECQYERNRSVLNYLMTVPVFSEDGLCSASYNCEAPETAFEEERWRSIRSRALGKGDH